MCGIVGRAGQLNIGDERIFKTLLLLDYFRGQDSTGVAIVSKTKKVDVLKVADDPIILFQHQDFDSHVVGTSDAIWIGHNRAATVGSTTRANAHPFKCDHITGVHNGTLEKDSLLDIRSRMASDYGTDSETIFQHIRLYGVDETVSRLSGAWALVWYDSKDETLNMVRNDKRPLYLCNTERGSYKFLTWASEYKMIVAARAMADVSDGKLIADEEGYGFFPLPVDTLHTWTLAQIMKGVDLTPETRELKGKPEAPKVTYPPVVVPFNNSSCSTKTASDLLASYDGGKSKGFKSIDDIYEVTDMDIEDDPLIFGIMDAQEWSEISRFGCACCGADLDPEEDGLIVYVNEGTALCPKCSGEATTQVVNGYGMQLNDRIIG